MEAPKHKAFPSGIVEQSWSSAEMEAPKHKAFPSGIVEQSWYQRLELMDNEMNQCCIAFHKQVKRDCSFLKSVCEQELARKQGDLHMKMEIERKNWQKYALVALAIEKLSLVRQISNLCMLLDNIKELRIFVNSVVPNMDTLKEILDRKDEIQTRLTTEVLEAQCLFTTLPNEILIKIMDCLKFKRDLCNMSMASKTFHAVAKDKIWNQPKFKYKMRPEDLLQLVALPIKVLETSALNITFDEKNTQQYVNVLKNFPHLTRVIIDSKIPPSELPLFQGLPLPLSVRLYQLSKISIANLKRYTDALTKLKNIDDLTNVSLYDSKYVSASSLQCFVNLPLKEIYSFDLAMNVEATRNFVNVLRNMRHLQRVVIHHSPRDYVLTPSDIVAFSHLPSHVKVHLMDICCLNLNRGNLNQFINAISDTKQLTLILEDFFYGSSTEDAPSDRLQFTVEEFKVFSSLRIEAITTMMLDIQDTNVEEFISILTEMKYTRNVRVIQPDWAAWSIPWHHLCSLRKLSSQPRIFNVLP